MKEQKEANRCSIRHHRSRYGPTGIGIQQAPFLTDADQDAISRHIVKLVIEVSYTVEFRYQHTPVTITDQVQGPGEIALECKHPSSLTEHQTSGRVPLSHITGRFRLT